MNKEEAAKRKEILADVFEHEMDLFNAIVDYLESTGQTVLDYSVTFALGNGKAVTIGRKRAGYELGKIEEEVIYDK